MAQTWTYTKTYAGTGSNTGWFQTEETNITISATGNTFRIKTPRLKVAATASRNDWTYGSTRKLRAGVHPSWRTPGLWIYTALSGTNSVASGVYSDWQIINDSSSFNTADYFNSSNPTERTISFGSWQGGNVECYYDGSGTNNSLYVPCYDNLSPANMFTVATVTIQLDVPPTADVSPISYDTGYIYSDLTTASVTVSNSTAYYDGTISSVEFKIGNQTATAAGDGTLSIALNAGGTFTPTVTVTDSRGQTYTETFSPITVNTYTAPTVSFDVERTDSTGMPDDEGTYGLIEATLTFADAIATAIAPSVVLTDENGTQTTPTVTWYTDDTLTTTVTWASISSGDTVYGLFSGVNTQYSYSVSVRPRDSEGTGTAITQTLGSAFYTVDFLAGGHGIAFGKPASNVGFECAMDATFEETLTAQDMTAQEVDDFVDSLVVGGGGTAVDLVVEQGTSGIWTYRKWSSGIAECWGTRASISAGFISWANGWYYSYFSGIALPFTFIDVPVVTQHCYSSGNDIYATGASIGNFGGLATTTNTGGTTLYRAGSGTIAIVVQYYVVGRWK